MKTKYIMAARGGLRLFAPVMLILFAAGCSSVGYKAGDSTADSLHLASRAIQVEQQALDATIGSLTELVNSPASDMKPQFKAYRVSLEGLVASVDKADKSMAHLRKKSAEYLDGWDSELAEMNYEIIRSSSEARKNVVSNQLESIYWRYQETQSVVKPFISYFADIQRSLGTDLTMDGLAAARAVVRNAEENTRKVQAALEQLTNEMNASSMRLSSVISVDAPEPATGRSARSSVQQSAAGLR
jgi:hypothetical protein